MGVGYYLTDCAHPCSSQFQFVPGIGRNGKDRQRAQGIAGRAGCTTLIMRRTHPELVRQITGTLGELKVGHYPSTPELGSFRIAHKLWREVRDFIIVAFLRAAAGF